MELSSQNMAIVDCSEHPGTRWALTQGKRTVVVMGGLNLGNAAVF